MKKGVPSQTIEQIKETCFLGKVVFESENTFEGLCRIHCMEKTKIATFSDICEIIFTTAAQMQSETKSMNRRTSSGGECHNVYQLLFLITFCFKFANVVYVEYLVIQLL